MPVLSQQSASGEQHDICGSYQGAIHSFTFPLLWETVSRQFCTAAPPDVGAAQIQSVWITAYSPPPFSIQPVGGEMRQAGPQDVFSVCLQLSEHNFYLLSTVENVFTWSQLISKFLISKHNLVSNRCFFFMCPRVNHIFLSFTVVVVKLFTMKSKNRLTSRTCLCHVSHLCL